MRQQCRRDILHVRVLELHSPARLFRLQVVVKVGDVQQVIGDGNVKLALDGLPVRSNACQGPLPIGVPFTETVVKSPFTSLVASRMLRIPNWSYAQKPFLE